MSVSINTNYEPPYPLEPEAERTFSSPELELLALYMENDEQLSAANRELRRHARDEQREAMRDKLDALEDKAAAIETGAWVEGSLTVAGGAALYQSAGGDDENWEIAAKVTNGLAGPAGDFFGDAPKARAERDVEAASQDFEQAGWVADDAGEAQRKLDKFTQTIFDQVQQIAETERGATEAVLANF